MTFGGNTVIDFPENQLATDFAFLCKPAWFNANVSFGGGDSVLPRLHHCMWITRRH